MEMLYILLLAGTVGILWLKPQHERLAWALFIISSILSIGIFLGVEHLYLVPMGNI
ncbi:MAG: hypothetical protein MR009_07230 [Sutterellaceae bacterium]|nr:hypothetical protein [Sutterellaceae bacterium]MDD7441397.1 hypothetical protein [Sutterellaceae bacterium]MDY2867895.1 hypothetical protein [Mesosutterella sp.]